MSIEAARRRVERANAAAEAATPGGLHGDPATLSGVRRQPNAEADARRFAAYDREAQAVQALTRAEVDAERSRQAAERAAADAAAPCDLGSLRKGDYVRDRHGWHRVLKVNPRSVTVETGFSWSDRLPVDRIIETRSA